MVAAVNTWVSLNPQTPRALVLLEADHPLVDATAAYLVWTPAAPVPGTGGKARVSMTTWQMVECFMTRCLVPRGGAVETAAEDISILQLRCPATFWTRILTELMESKLVEALDDKDVNNKRDFIACVAALPLADPTKLALTVPDLSAAGEDFDIPGVPARGRGNAHVPAAPAVPGPDGLRFLAHVPLTALELVGDAAPFKILSRLTGMLGPCLTRAVREKESSTVRSLGGLIATHMRERFGDDSDAVLATCLPDYLKELTLPKMLASVGNSEAEAFADARDAMIYHRSETGRRNVELSRLDRAVSR